jgi:hypothetical protein
MSGDAPFIAIRLVSGNFYLTAEGGGGRTTDPNTDPIHTNRRVTQGIDVWEKFTLHDQADGTWAIQTYNGVNYLTAEGGGGRTTDTIHTNATAVGPWEKFTLEFQNDGTYAIKTANGNYISAVPNRSQNAVRTDAIAVGTAEKFWLIIAFPL